MPDGAARSHFVRGVLPHWQCGTCLHQTSLISGTIFEATDRRPLYACLNQQPPTLEAMVAFAASQIAPTAIVVSDALWLRYHESTESCFMIVCNDA